MFCVSAFPTYYNCVHADSTKQVFIGISKKHFKSVLKKISKKLKISQPTCCIILGDERRNTPFVLLSLIMLLSTNNSSLLDFMKNVPQQYRFFQDLTQTTVFDYSIPQQQTWKN